jgi:hypothetical protein
VGELLDLRVPVFQDQLTGEDAGGEDFGGGIEWDVLVGFFGLEDEVAEFCFAETDDASTGFIVGGSVSLGDSLGKKLGDPWDLDGGG